MSKKSKSKKQNKAKLNAIKAFFIQKAFETIPKQSSNNQTTEASHKSTQDDVLLTLIRSYFDFNKTSVERGIALLSDLVLLAKDALHLESKSEAQKNADSQKTEQMRMEKDFEKQIIQIKNDFELEKMKLQNANIIPKSDFDKAHSVYKYECDTVEKVTSENKNDTEDVKPNVDDLSKVEAENIYDDRDVSTPTAHFMRPNYPYYKRTGKISTSTEGQNDEGKRKNTAPRGRPSKKDK